MKHLQTTLVALLLLVLAASPLFADIYDLKVKRALDFESYSRVLDPADPVARIVVTPALNHTQCAESSRPLHCLHRRSYQF